VESGEWRVKSGGKGESRIQVLKGGEGSKEVAAFFWMPKRRVKDEIGHKRLKKSKNSKNSRVFFERCGGCGSPDGPGDPSHGIAYG
jgi:hypothetical protein